MTRMKVSALLLLTTLFGLAGAQEAFSQSYSDQITTGQSFANPARYGSGYYYDERDIYATQSGSYTMRHDWNFDGYLLLYQNNFDPNNSSANLITYNDDYGSIYTSQITYTLQTGTKYILVSSTYSAGNYGSYTGQITGPAQVSFTPTNAAPEADAAQGSSFSGNAGSGFSLTAQPGAMLQSATVTLSDSDMDDITISSVTAQNGNVSGVTAPSAANAQQGPISLTWSGSVAANQAPGSYTWAVSITDGTDTLNFDVTIEVADVEPELTAGNDVQSGMGTSGSPYSLNAYTPFVANLTLGTVSDGNTGQTVTLSAQNQTGGPTNIFQFALANDTVTISTNGAVQPGDVGTHTFEIDLSDGGANTVTIYVEIVVPPNAAPEARLPQSSAFGGDFANGFTLSLNPGAGLADATLELFDFNGDNVALNSVSPSPSAITGVTAPATITASPGPHTVRFTGTIDAMNTPGDYVYTLELEDGVNAAITFDVTITVVDIAPRFTPTNNVLGGDGSMGNPLLLNATEGTTPTFNLATVSDANASQTVSLGAVNQSSTGTNQMAFTADLTAGALSVAAAAQLGAMELGTHDLEIELSDGSNTTPVYVQITVAANQQPEALLAMGTAFTGDQMNGFALTAPPSTALANASLRLRDLDVGDSVEVKSVTIATPINGVTAPMTQTGATGAAVTITWTGSPDGATTPGDFVYTITIGDGVTADVSFDVTITVPDVAPTHVVGPDATSGDGSMGDPYSGITSINATAMASLVRVSDANSAQQVNASVTNLSFAIGGAATDFAVQLSSGEIVISPNGAQIVGTYLYEVQLDDGTNVETIYVGMEVFVNSPPVSSPAMGSSFTGSQGAGFVAEFAPNATLSAADIRIADLDMDDVTVSSIVPQGLIPFGVTAPATVPSQAGPYNLTWNGMIESTNAPGDYSWLITMSDGNADVSFTATIRVLDVAPVASAGGDAIDGDGSAGTPFRGITLVGRTSPIQLAELSDLNRTQVLSVSNVTGAGSNPVGGAGFSMSVQGSQLVAIPNAALNSLDTGTYTFEVEISDGGANTIEVVVQIDVVGSPVAQLIVSGGPTNDRISNGGGLSFAARPTNEGVSNLQTVIVKNIGVGTMTLSSLMLGGTDAGEFILDDSAFASMLLPGEQTMFAVSFDPSTVGMLSAEVSFVHDATNTGTPFTITLAGEGLAEVNFAPTLTLTQGSVTVADGGSIAVPFGASMGSLQISLNVDDPNGDNVSVSTQITNVTSQAFVSSEFGSTSMAVPYSLTATSGNFNVDGVIHELMITADDGNGGMTSMTVSLVVLSQLQAPPTITVNSSLGQISPDFMIPVEFGSMLEDLNLSVTVDDPNGDAVTLSATISNVLNEGLDEAQFSQAAAATPFTLNPTDGQFLIPAATHMVTLTADDGMGNQTELVFTFVVGAAPPDSSSDSGSCSLAGESHSGLMLLLLAAFAGFAALGLRRKAALGQ